LALLQILTVMVLKMKLINVLIHRQVLQLMNSDVRLTVMATVFRIIWINVLIQKPGCRLMNMDALLIVTAMVLLIPKTDVPILPKGVAVNEFGCPDSDADGVPDNEDKCR
jgi:hypothetical protein